ncbi:hypothetical protein [Trinickia sp. EG282A]|uniref:hypothetical protein n=1 Tax=Trinickia sp. EG282A TaxID=3237013 RepID=UPI0034D3817A
MKRTGFNTFVAAVLLAVSSVTLADGSDGRAARIGWHVRQPTRFMVSGVLRKNGTTDVIKPIQAIIAADNDDTAIKMFAKTAERDYPAYALIATLASPVPAAGKCENSI